MRCLLAACSLCLMTVSLAGCTLCASPYDCDYGLYGGSWQRHDQANGRVGSAFNNAGAPTNPTPEEVIQTPGTPTPTDSPNRPTTPSTLRPDMTDPVSSPPAGAPSNTASRRSGARRGVQLRSDE